MASNTENKGAMSAKAALQANSIFCVSVAIGTPTVNIIVHHKKGQIWSSLRKVANIWNKKQNGQHNLNYGLSL